VYQRDFNQNFALRNYSVNTGHATAYWDTGFSDVLLKLQVGQYLAGDRGATMDISRRFNNGVVLGAYATKTNVSAAQFGEGSFDKGIYLSMPFDVMLPKYSDQAASGTWQPLTRDGGARLARANTLYNVTSARDGRAFQFGPPVSSSVANRKADDRMFVAPEALTKELHTPSIAESVVRSANHAAEQLTHPASQTPWLWGAAAVLGAAVLDNQADRWAINHPQLTSVAKIGNAIPLLLGTGALVTSMDGGVGFASLKSAGITLGANMVLRASVGRARPEEGVSNGHFSPFSAASLKSGFASNHVAATVALATPFAQIYDLPWLYGFGAITALGRIQSRQHWLSDTVAGGVIGYAVGSAVSDEYKELNASPAKAGRQLLVSPQGVAAKWWWQ
jgi:membrane-associated phospholipid phosphatase